MKYIINILISIFLVIIIIFITIIYSLNSTLINPNTYINTLSKNNIYQNISQNLLPELMMQSINIGDYKLNDNQANSLINELKNNLNQNVLKEEINKIIKNFFAFIKNSTEKSLYIDLIKFSHFFNSKNIQSIIYSDENLKIIYQNTLKCEENTNIDCIPSNISEEDFISDFKQKLSTSQIDNTSPIPESIELNTLYAKRLSLIQQIYKYNLFAFKILIALFIFLIFIQILLYKNKKFKIFKNLSIIFFVSSLLLIIIFTTIKLFYISFLESLFSQLPNIFSDIITTNTISLINIYITRNYIIAFIILILSIILYIFSNKYKYIIKED